MAGQGNCRAVDGGWCCTFWLSQSGHRHQFTILMLAVNYHLLTLYPRHHTFWRCQTGLIFVLLCYCRLADRIQENNKMVLVELRLVSSQTRLLPTMTLYSTIIHVYCWVQLKKKVEWVLAKVNTSFHGTWCWHVQTDRLPRSGKRATPSAISRMVGGG